MQNLLKSLGTIFWIIAVFVGYTPLMMGQLRLMETDELRLISYDFGHDYLLPHVSRCFHRALDFHQALFDYQPQEKVTVLIQDFGDHGNAGATAIPKNFISMGLSPFSYAFETSPAGERIFSMMNHELVHVVALDNGTGSDHFFQKVFAGKVSPTSDHPISMFYSYLTSPRMYAPRWYHEGLAAYIETWMNGGIGLAMGSYDEMVFRTLVLEGARIYDAQGLESEGVTTDFQGRTNSYLYGTRFIGYLTNQYGPQKVIEWAKRNRDSKAFFAGQFKQVFGIPIQDGWNDWIAFEEKWQNQNIQKLRKNPITETAIISDQVIGSVSYPHYDKERNLIYVAVNYPGTYPHLASINLESGAIKNLVDIKGPALFYVSSVVFDKEEDVLYYTTDNNAWRDLMLYDIKSGKTQLLMEDIRVGDIALNKKDHSLWGIKHLNGYSTIVRIPKNPSLNGKLGYSKWDQVLTLSYGHDIFDIDISPDGSQLSAAVSDLRGKQSLILYPIDQLMEGEIHPDTIFDFDVSSPQSFRFTENGSHLIGSSYYSGVSNIFKVDLQSREISVMSNGLTGLFRPLELNAEEMLCFEYTSRGFRPVLIDNQPVNAVSSIGFLGNETIEKFPELMDWEISIPTESDEDLMDLSLTEEVYSPFKEMRLNYAYPTIVGYKNVFGLGYAFHISDPLYLRELKLEAAYTPLSWTNHLSNLEDTLTTIEDDERFHFSIEARSGEWTFAGSYNQASFYDLFGPRIHSRRGIDASLTLDKSLIWDLPRRLDLKVKLGGFYGLDRSPEFQQFTIDGFRESLFLQASSSLVYSHLKRSLGGVESEKGIRSAIHLSLARSDGSYFPKIFGELDYGIQLPFSHSSFWVRGAAGSTFSDVLNPFSRFGFAAFGNNYLDYRPFRQYRSPFSFAGYGFNNSEPIITQNFGKITGEWVLPPIRFRKVGGFNFFANWTQASLFSSFLSTSSPETGHQQYLNLGGQVSTRMVMFSHLPATLSIGYARAWQLDDNHHFGEFLISLKLLK